MIKALTYDDIQIVPQYSEINTRSRISLRTKLSRNFELVVPYVASPMDTVCESAMAIKLMKLGAVGCIHRFMSIEDQTLEVSKVLDSITNTDRRLWNGPIPIMASVGVSSTDLNRALTLIEAGCNVIVIDVAHGHHLKVKYMIQAIKDMFAEGVDVIAGNIVTKEAAFDLVEWGADGLRVGIGGGSLCTTRLQTGHGLPNVLAIQICVNADVPVMADGGIKTSGDIAKAMALGADCVMLGSMFAGTKESPGKVIEKGPNLYKRYRGSASLEIKSAHGQEERNVEGEATIVPFKGGVKYIVKRLNEGLRSALSYSGAANIQAYQAKADIVEITNSGIAEAKPHLL